MTANAPQTDPGAGKSADPSMLGDAPRLMTACYTRRPDAAVPEQQAFGTSGHRGSAFDCAWAFAASSPAQSPTVPTTAPVAVCGELARQFDAVPTLLKLGIRSLSVAPPLVPGVKEVVRQAVRML